LNKKNGFNKSEDLNLKNKYAKIKIFENKKNILIITLKKSDKKKKKQIKKKK